MNFPSLWLLLLGLPLLPALEKSGIKMTIQRGGIGGASQHTTYWQGDRKREEYQNSLGEGQPDGSIKPIYGPHIASIIRCDLGQMFELNLDTSEYTSAPYPPKPFTKEEREKRGIPDRISYLSDKPTLRVEVTTTDTGERKEMFGHTARHVITKTTQTPLENSRSNPQETLTDGWYIDFDQRLSCDLKLRDTHSHGFQQAHGRNQPWERPEFVTNGTPEAGFALRYVATTKGSYTRPDGTKRDSETKSEMRVIQFEEGALDPALFEIPPGFKHVDRIERNPAVAAFTNQPPTVWQRFKDEVASLFNR